MHHDTFFYCSILATSCGHREVVMTLLKHGADHTSLDNSGQSAQEICEPSIKDVFQNMTKT